MKTPALAHVPDITLPHVDVHGVTDLVGERAGDVGEIVTQAWSSGLDHAQDLAAAAKDVLEDFPDKAVALAGAVIPALRPSPKRSRRPVMILVAVLASVMIVAWILKRRRSGTAEPYAVTDQAPATNKVSAVS